MMRCSPLNVPMVCRARTTVLGHVNLWFRMYKPMVDDPKTDLRFPKRDLSALKSLFAPAKSVFPTEAFTPSQPCNKLFLNRIV